MKYKFLTLVVSLAATIVVTAQREHININSGWRFMRYNSAPDSLLYDVRPEITHHNDNMVADTKPVESAQSLSSTHTLKKWILPIANEFIKDPAKYHQRPEGNPGNDFPFVQNNFNDNRWQPVDLPHDWAIQAPFYKGNNTEVGGGMGRLPSQGVAWYRRSLFISKNDKNKILYLDIDGAMSYAMVWINGKLAGGWPYGYNSFRLNITPYVKYESNNQLAIRIDNPNYSSRWYPGGGIYRNVWLTKVNPVHIAHWGTTVQTSHVSAASASAKVNLCVQIENNSTTDGTVKIITDVFALNNKLKITGDKIIRFPAQTINIKRGTKEKVETTVTIQHPLLWGPRPKQNPNLYMAISHIYKDGKLVDEYQTRFGIRSIQLDPEKGLLVNGIPTRIQGVNQHHDLGALGAAFNISAAKRQLKLLQEMGCNAIRLAHNPPAPELLDLTDEMGFLVIDEIFDCWEKGKTPLDFHLIFSDWYEADIRAFIRRDKNHPSVMEWSFGNEVGEQYTVEEGAVLAKKLYNIVKDEDSTRPATASMNYAKPDMPFPKTMDVLSLNYQGEGIRDAPAYAHLKGIRTTPLYASFQKYFPDKIIQSSETASTLSTRGTYIFPITNGISAPVSDTTGGDPANMFVSAYDLYTAQFGASPDKVFFAQDHHPFVAGEFVWSGWDYLGEPTPYYSARSSYSGIIDLAGFKKDRFYLYQSRWLSDTPMAHILPHWNWPDRIGKPTPVHIYTSGDEAELFLNNKSLGRKKKGAYEYRLRWDSVIYESGELKVVTYKNGKQWATDIVQTSDKPAQLQLVADKNNITANEDELCFITLKVLDKNGLMVPDANNKIKFEINGSGEIVATDNGNPADLVSFASTERNAFNGLALVIVRAAKGNTNSVKIMAHSSELASAEITIKIDRGN